MVSEHWRNRGNEHDYKDAKKDEIVEVPFVKFLKSVYTHAYNYTTFSVIMQGWGLETHIL